MTGLNNLCPKCNGQNTMEIAADATQPKHGPSIVECTRCGHVDFRNRVDVPNRLARLGRVTVA
jgi:Zn ribbon nucleic-acid-binding protein